MSTVYCRGLLGVLLTITFLACASSQPYVWASRYGMSSAGADEWSLGPGDEISVLVADQASLSGTFKIGADGRYVQPVVGSIALGGLTLAQAESQLRAKLDGILVRPKVTVALTKRRVLNIAVMGEVKRSGRFAVEFDEGILSLLSRAEGLTEYADLSSIYVVRRQPELLRIRFRLRDLAKPDPISANFRLTDGDVIVVE